MYSLELSHFIIFASTPEYWSCLQVGMKAKTENPILKFPIIVQDQNKGHSKSVDFNLLGLTDLVL